MLARMAALEASPRTWHLWGVIGSRSLLRAGLVLPRLHDSRAAGVVTAVVHPTQLWWSLNLVKQWSLSVRWKDDPKVWGS